MCGIAGIYTPGKPVDRDALLRMNRALAHRGPDASGIWSTGDIGLAHTRLKIIDLSERAAQPMTSANKAITLTFNGEIYNFKRLRRELEQKGAEFRSNSDTEVLLEGYAVFGEGVLEKLEGMFAFALWDASRERLFLARDRAGEKPLYYLPLPNGGVIFGSEMKAIFAVQGAIERDYTRLPEFLLYGYVPHPRTFYRDVRCLEPGASVTFGTGATGVSRSYWSPNFSASDRPPTYLEAKEALRVRMREIVRDRLEADVPIGAFLSGGLDSSAIVGVATKDLGREVHTYSIGFAEPEWDESKDARISAKHLGSIHEEFIVSVNDMPEVEAFVGFYDEPFAEASLIPTYLVSKLARSHVTVALTGDGGDEAFGGYLRFVGGSLAERLPRGLGTLGRKAVETVESWVPEKARRTLERAERIAKSVERPLERRFLAWSGVFPMERIDDLLRPDLKAEMEDAPRFSDEIFQRTAGQTAIARMLDHNFRSYLPCDLLVKVDRCSMAVALETRCPLLDSSLVDFVGGLPDDYKVRGLTTKRILRETFADLYAPELLKRPKRGFGVPLGKWLRGPLRAALEAAVRPKTARLYDFLSHEAVERTYFSGNDLSRQNQATQLWTLWVLETWLQRKEASFYG